MDESGDKRSVNAPAAKQTPRGASSRLALLTLVLAAVLSALVWLDARQRIAETQEQVARRLREMEREGGAASALAQQAQNAVRELQASVAQLDARLNDAREKQRALDAMYQDLARNRDEWQLAEIEQILDIASQQLRLAGNVRAALLALQLADARLARADRPQFAPIRRALASDIERLKSVQTPDIPGLSAKLDALVGAVDELPIGAAERASPAGARTSAPAEQGALARLGADLWEELRGLVVLRRIDTPEPPLLPPTQAYFLRENLRLRLLDARISLLAQDSTGYRADLRVARDWIKRYFDPGSKLVAAALAQIEQLRAAPLAAEMPSIAQSLDAVRSFRK
ncbi:MAG TPA: uroporphyrinogen-III C-methyltransferase [Burkholderiales bacterium]|nr:uroporphyrinogen-III C-methyltransferase [Burkholderiales bacterium]